MKDRLHRGFKVLIGEIVSFKIIIVDNKTFSSRKKNMNIEFKECDKNISHHRFVIRNVL